MKNILKITTTVAIVTPLFAFASGLADVFQTVLDLLNLVIPILITLGIVYFIWGVIQYVVSGDMEKKEQGQQHMIWGLVGLFVIVAMWGLVAILSNTLFDDVGGPPTDTPGLPCVSGDGIPGAGSPDGC